MTKTKTSEKSGYHHGDLRAALVTATRALIEEKGIDHFSVSDACRKAGVSTAAPYKHFRSKDEMVAAVMLQSMDRHRAEMLAEVAPHPKGSVDRIRAIGRNYIDFALREPGVFRLRFAQFGPSHTPDVEEAGNEIYDFVQNEVAQVLGEPGITDKVRQRSFMLWSFVHGMSLLLMVPELSEKGGHMDPEQMLDEMGRRLLVD